MNPLIFTASVIAAGLAVGLALMVGRLVVLCPGPVDYRSSWAQTSSR